jgi:hypothetical protein
MKFISLFFFTLLVANVLVAQHRSPLQADVAFATHAHQQVYALSGVQYFSVGNGKFRLGPGVRFSVQHSGPQEYLTAPARLTSGQAGPQVIFTAVIPANYDTLRLSNTQVNSLNLSLNFQYDLGPKLTVGFNIDAIGISLGAVQDGGTFAPGEAARAQGKTAFAWIGAEPTRINGLLVSDNDRGTLNSELYAAWHLSDNLFVKSGASFGFTEYRTATGVGVDGNDRFRNKALMGMIGLGYAFGARE